MRHHEARDPQLALHAQDEVVDDARRHGIQPRGRFVIQEDFRLERQGPGQGEPFFHAARKFVGHLRAHVRRQVDQLQFLAHQRVQLRFRKLGPVFPYGELDVLAGIHRIEQGGTLEQHAHAAADRLGVHALGGGNHLPFDADLARIGFQQADAVLENHRFPAARSPDDHQGFPARDVQRHAPQDFLLPAVGGKGFPQVAELNQGGVGQLRSEVQGVLRKLNNPHPKGSPIKRTPSREKESLKTRYPFQVPFRPAN
jgi:hypothetical protein